MNYRNNLSFQMKVLLCKIFLFFSLIVSAQQFEKAIVTDLNFIRRYSVDVNGDIFPFYFQEKGFIKDIQSEIRLLIEEKFGVSEVLFLTPDSITYVEESVAPKLQVKDYAIYTKRETTVFISVETILQFYATVEQEKTYRFTTRINAYNNSGKKVYSFKNHIPFTTYWGDEISGLVQMSEPDFYTFYFDGLYLAFAGKNKSIEKRYIAAPSADLFSDFTQAALKFYLLTEMNGYGYGADYNNLSEALQFGINYWAVGRDDVFNFRNLATVDFLDGGYSFMNQFDEQEYQVRLRGGVNSLRDTYDPLADINWELLSGDGVVISIQTYDKNGSLKGEYDAKEISLLWNGEYSCLEFYYQKELLALVNYNLESKVLYLSKDISQASLKALINSIFIYDYSRAVRTRLILNYRN